MMPRHSKLQAALLTETLWRELRSARFLEGAGLSLRLSGSFGVATFPDDATTVTEIIKISDKMMYEAKIRRDFVAIRGITPETETRVLDVPASDDAAQRTSDHKSAERSSSQAGAAPDPL